MGPLLQTSLRAAEHMITRRDSSAEAASVSGDGAAEADAHRATHLLGVRRWLLGNQPDVGVRNRRGDPGEFQSTGLSPGKDDAGGKLLHHLRTPLLLKFSSR